MVGGQFHDKRGRATGKEPGLLEHQTRSDDGKHAQEVEERRNPAGARRGIADDRTHEQGDDRQLGAAGNERRGHDRHAAVLLVLNGLGGHDARNAAARGDEHRNERLTRQAKAAEDAIHDKGDASHIAAVLQEREHHEQQEHLRDEAHDGADAGHDTVADEGVDKTAVLGAARHKGVMHRGGDAGDERTVVGGVGLSNIEVRERLRRGDGGGSRAGVLVLLDLALHGRGLGLGCDGLERVGGSVAVLGVDSVVIGRNVDTLGVGRVDKRGDLGLSLRVLASSLVICIATLAQHEPAIGAKELIIGEVGHRAAERGHGDVVDSEHDDDEDRQTEDTVGDNAVNLLGGAHLCRSLDEALVDDMGNHAVALAGDDGLGIVVAVLLALGNELLHALGVVLREVDKLARSLIALKELDGVVTALLGRNACGE